MEIVETQTPRLALHELHAPHVSLFMTVIAVAFAKSDYLSALRRAGAEVRELSPERDPLPRALDACDGVLLTGGVDVDPAEYGDPERHPTTEVDPVRDAYELAIAREALARDLPLFAICRGVQVLNVAAGGTLIQDLPSQHGTAVAHTQDATPQTIAHAVSVLPGTRLAGLLTDRLDAGGRVDVNSRHHQSIKTTAPGFVVSATAPDDVIEAIERPDAMFCVGVQWHPENFWQTGDFAALFAALVRAANEYRERPRS
jgi:putative glutamine amidotransferase